jgi:uncharacterized membrane protein YphA (DoxX/SURF4 family)
MKTTKIIYWTLTAIVGIMMIFSAFAYLTKVEAKEGFAHLGFPDYFRVELAVAKILGVAALLIPLATRIKEWAYAGFAINFTSAAIAHVASGDPVQNVIGPVIFLVILVGSYLTYHKIQSEKKKLSTNLA